MQDYVHSLGDAVKRARGRLGLSQRKLAEIASIDARTVLDIENYRGNPKLEVLYPLVRALSLDVREIFFPEVMRESPYLSELRLMVEGCNEAEAAVMVEVFESVLNAIRHGTPANTK